MSDKFQAFVAARELKPRTKSSCRFAPYYKAQWYDEKALAWRDIPERFSTIAEARARFNERHKWRAMEVSMSGRIVL